MNSDSEKDLQNQAPPIATSWTKANLRQLRLRMGWSRSDIARRLQCSTEEVELLEEGSKIIESRMKSELEILLRQAETNSDDVRFTPSAENKCDKDALQQVDFSKVKADFE